MEIVFFLVVAALMAMWLLQFSFSAINNYEIYLAYIHSRFFLISLRS